MKGSAAKMPFWASQRKTYSDSLTTYFLLLDWRFVRRRGAWEGGNTNYIIFLECPLPPCSAQSTDPLPSLCCVMFDSTPCSARTSCRVGLESAERIWGGGLPRRSSVCLEGCTAPSLQTPTYPIFGLFYLPGEEPSPALSLAPPLQVGWTMYVFMCECVCISFG